MINWSLRRSVTLRPIITTRAQTDTLYRIYAPVVRIWADAVPSILSEYERTISSMTTDSVSDLEDIIERTDSNAVAAVFSFRWFFGRYLDNLVAWHLNRFIANLKYATNIDASSIIGPAPRDTLEAIIARNVALVRNVSDQTRERISDAVYRSITNRTSVRDLSKEISGILGGQRKRALRIASDQTVKISAAMDTARANDLGLYEWEWLHSKKVHFRPIHKARDGSIYDDRDLPASVRDDQPGQAPFCGCAKRYIVS